jgi:hypothetical protein
VQCKHFRGAGITIRVVNAEENIHRKCKLVVYEKQLKTQVEHAAFVVHFG